MAAMGALRTDRKEMTLVVDASVALKWQFEDEEATDSATQLLKDYVEGNQELVSPTLFAYEVLSGIQVAIRRGLISETSGLKAFRFIQALDIPLRDFTPLAEKAFRMSRRLQISPYDAAYLSLAQAEGVEMITGDRRLLRSVARHLPWVRWIGDFRAQGSR
jgi:predicted nucleic acid-binding protein